MQDRQKISIHALREEGDYRHHGRRSSGAISIHALREEGDLPVKPKRRGDVKFLSTPSARRATKLIPTYSPDIAISIHALREEGDDNRLEYEVVGHGFLSTPSARRATWRGRFEGGDKRISIHALREEGDVESLGTANADRLFLSTPSARRATEGLQELAQKVKFLSTPSARRATSSWSPCGGRWRNFYPRPPRGGRPPRRERWLPTCPISIHALREEGDIRQDVPNHALF